jgi:hypothetical protein
MTFSISVEAGLGLRLVLMRISVASGVNIFQSASRLDAIVSTPSCMLVFKRRVLSKNAALELVGEAILRKVSKKSGLSLSSSDDKVANRCMTGSARTSRFDT